MIDAVSFGGLCVAVLSFAWTEYRIRHERHYRLRVGPANEVRQALIAVRQAADEVIHAGGMNMSSFLRGDMRQLDERLADLREQLTDPKLGRLIDGAVSAWKQTFSKAPVSQGLRSYPPGQLTNPTYAIEDNKRAEACAHQVLAARDAREACVKALDHLNALLRKR